MLAFVVYRVWGTGIKQQSNQRALEKQFEKVVDTSRNFSSQVPELPLVGDAIGKISIPVIDVNAWLVAGAKLKQLENGPGVFAGSPLPGQVGNVAIAGHRESYGGPFEHLDMLQKGDDVVFTTQQGTFTYRVTGSKVVSANEVGVIRTVDPSRALLTLVTCHPKWTSKDRLIVTGELVSLRAPLRATPVAVVGDNPATVDGVSTDTVGSIPGWFHDTSRALPTALWSVGCVAVWWMARRLAGKRPEGSRRIRLRNVSAWIVSAPVFVVCLYMAFDNLTGLLPANF